MCFIAKNFTVLAHINNPIKPDLGKRKRLEKEKGNLVKRKPNDTVPWDKQAVMTENMNSCHSPHTLLPPLLIKKNEVGILNFIAA